jgi:transposase
METETTRRAKASRLDGKDGRAGRDLPATGDPRPAGGSGAGGTLESPALSARTPGAPAKRISSRKIRAELPPVGCPAGTPTRSSGAVDQEPKGSSTMRSVALDLGAKKIAYCEVSGGKVIARVTVDSLLSLEAMLGPSAQSARVAIEACRQAWFVHAKLTEWGNEVLLVDTTRSRQMGIGQHRRKNDRIDAEVMALAVETGGIPVAHLLSPHRQELRRQLGVRRALVETRAQYVTTVRGLASEHGYALRSCDTEQFVANVRKAKLSVQLRATIEPLLATLEPLEVQLAAVEQRLLELCATEPVISQLTTTPGVGPIVAASFVSVIDDAGRFGTAHHVESYLGLVPSENTTGGKRRLGAISKQGNSYLRALLVQSAWLILRQPARTDPLQRWALAIAERRGKRIAVVALARRLAGVLWAMWRNNTVYEPELVARAGARGLRRAAQDIEFRAAALERAALKLRRHRTRPAKATEVSISR